MKYTLNNTLVFDVENQTIHMVNEDINVIELSSMMITRLLEALVEKAGEVLTREYLYQTVWENHGYKASASNLNKSMSLLRKAIRDTGYQDDIIETLPRQGFRLLATVESDAPAASGTDPLVKKRTISNKKKTYLKVGGVAILFIALAMTYFVYVKEQPRYNMVRVEKCTVYFVDKKPRAYYTDKIKNISHDVDCSSKERLVVYGSPLPYEIDEDDSNQKEPLDFTAICNRDGGLSKCTNIINMRQ